MLAAHQLLAVMLPDSTPAADTAQAAVNAVVDRSMMIFSWVNYAEVVEVRKKAVGEGMNLSYYVLIRNLTRVRAIIFNIFA